MLFVGSSSRLGDVGQELALVMPASHPELLGGIFDPLARVVEVSDVTTVKSSNGGVTIARVPRMKTESQDRSLLP